MVKLRLKRYGKKREPSYRIIAIQDRERREGRPLQELGFYNPRTKETRLNTPEIVKWLRHGAQPTDPLDRLFKRAGIYDMLKASWGDGVVATVKAIGIPEEPIEATRSPDGSQDSADGSQESQEETASSTS
jgi:small subunit ribosomal protein S16